MEKEAAIEKIKDLTADKLGIPREKIGLTTNFFSESGADSLQMLGFIAMLEKDFDIEVDDEDVKELYCVENVLKMIQSKKA